MRNVSFLNTKKHSSSFCKQNGLSLIELMIAMGLGVFLVAVALTLCVGISSTGSTTDGLAATQENGRFALTLVTRNIRMAGYFNTNEGDAEGGESFFTDACGDFNPCTANGAGDESDRMAIWYDPPVNDGTATDCTGAAVDDDEYIANVYYVEGGNLVCRGWDPELNAWNSQAAPLVQGIDNFQILYGVSDSDGERIVRYRTADTVSGNDWTKGIASVQVGFLVNSGQPINAEHQTGKEYQVLDGPELTFNDLIARKVYTATVAVNNATQHLK